MKKEDFILPNEAILRLLLITEEKFIVGFFDLSDKDKTWTFKYSDAFIYSKKEPLLEFPIIKLTYGHETCVKWLLERVRLNDNKKCLDLPDAISNGNGQIGKYLQLHIIQ